MKTLLERLKPEYLEKLEAEAVKYPYMVQALKHTLEKFTVFIQLDIYTAHQICILSEVEFGIIAIDNLFNKHE